MRCEGDLREVKEAVALGLPGQLVMYGGGGLACGVLTGLSAAFEKLGVQKAPVHLFGESAGTTIAMGHNLGMIRKLRHLFPSRFCSERFIRNRLLALLLGRSVLDLEYLRDVLDCELCHPPRHTANTVSMTVTRYATGEQELRTFGAENMKEMLQCAIASCTLPGLVREPARLDGVRYIDGMIGGPPPVRELVERFDPPAGILAVPWGEGTLDDTIGTICGEAFYYNMMRWVPTRIWERIWNRRMAYLELIEWIRAELTLPIGSSERTLPPFLILWFEEGDRIGRTGADPSEMRRAMSAAHRSCLRLFEESVTEKKIAVAA